MSDFDEREKLREAEAMKAVHEVERGNRAWDMYRVLIKDMMRYGDVVNFDEKRLKRTQRMAELSFVFADVWLAQRSGKTFVLPEEPALVPQEEAPATS